MRIAISQEIDQRTQSVTTTVVVEPALPPPEVLVPIEAHAAIVETTESPSETATEHAPPAAAVALSSGPDVAHPVVVCAVSSVDQYELSEMEQMRMKALNSDFESGV